MARITRFPSSRIRLALAASVLALSAAAAHGAQDAALPPALGKPLQAAQTLLAKGKYREALARIAQTDAVAKKRPSDILVIEQLRGNAAQRLGDAALARQAYEKAVAQPGLSNAQRQPLAAALASLHYQQGDYAEAAQWARRYADSGGSDPQIRSLIVHALYQGGDCAGLAAYLDQPGAGRPDESALQALVACRTRGNDAAGAWEAMLRLAQHYPQPRYWQSLIDTVQRQPGLPPALRLEAYRLRLASTGALAREQDYLEMAQLALQAGLPIEGLQVLTQGFQQGVLGQGAQQERHLRLRRYAEAQAAQAQTRLDALAAELRDNQGSAEQRLAAGYNLIAAGRHEEGLALLRESLAAQDALPDEARLQWGAAQWGAGQHRQALATFTQINAGRPAGALAQVWKSYAATQIR